VTAACGPTIVALIFILILVSALLGDLPLRPFRLQ
jgi:hypothetical protein